MLEVMQFIFQDIWHYLGTFLLLLAIFPVVTIRTKKEDRTHDPD